MTTARGDRVLPASRALGVFIVPFLLVAFPLLYLFPNDTGNWWAWEIRPSMTALIMGAGYIAGAYFFVRVARASRWHRVHLGFPPITAFTAFLGVATIIYWDRFDHDHVAFWLWTGLYVTTPFLVPLAWLHNRQTDPGTLESTDDRYLPQGVRSILKALGLLQFAIGAVLLASPSTMIDIWPWMLTPLAAATLGAWFALPGVTALMMGIDGRWSAIRITLESQLVGLALILLATARAWEQFDKSTALTYAFAGGIALLLVGLAALWSSMVLRQLRATEPAPTPRRRSRASLLPRSGSRAGNGSAGLMLGRSPLSDLACRFEAALKPQRRRALAWDVPRRPSPSRVLRSADERRSAARAAGRPAHRSAARAG